MDWDELRYFITVIQYENISHAAKALGVSPQTVSRKITALEAKLGTALFIRHPRGYKPTVDAMSLTEEVRLAEKMLNTIQNNFMSKSKKFVGVVRIAAPELIVTEIILPHLKPFLDRYPEIDIELITGINTVGIAKGDADIALRLVRPEQGALTIKKVGIMSSGLYRASNMTDNINEAKLVGWDTHIDLSASRWLNTITRREPQLKLNSLAAQRTAIQSGLGIGILPCFIAAGLERIEQPYLLEETLWLVTHASNTATPRIRLVYDELSEIMASNRFRLHPTL